MRGFCFENNGKGFVKTFFGKAWAGGRVVCENGLHVLVRPRTGEHGAFKNMYFTGCGVTLPVQRFGDKYNGEINSSFLMNKFFDQIVKLVFIKLRFKIIPCINQYKATVTENLL